MRRAPALLLLLSLPAFAAAEKWYEAYNRGVEAVRAKSYAAGADALARAAAEMPNESGAARAGNVIITYTPHFWLGIARFNLGDLDGALREWKTSEEQGAVQNTPYYAQLREWVARANQEKQRRTENAAADSKREANAALGAALEAQGNALSAGADRSDAYRAAHRKLLEANDTNAKAGTDLQAYKHAAELATQARDLFVAAAAEARRVKASRPVPQPKPQPQPRTIDVAVPFEPAPPTAPPPAPVPQPQPQPGPEVESEALVSARVAVQAYRRHLLEAHLPSTEAQKLDRELAGKPDEKTIARVAELVAEKEKELAKPKTVDVSAPKPDPRAALESAYRAFAAGDFAASDAILSELLRGGDSAEAYLLRGCARYTRAVLGRESLDPAGDDFRAALKMNKALRLDRSAFSPKLVAYFESIRPSS